jgi:hypothetical protein
MSAKQWFSLRTLFKQRKLDLVVLKKREVLRFLGIHKSFFTLDVDNICFISSTDFLFLSKLLDKKTFVTTRDLRPFLFRVNFQFLTSDYLKKFFSSESDTVNKIFLNNFMFFSKNLYYFKLNLFLNINLLLNIKILNLKE